MKQLMVVSHDTYAHGLTVGTSDLDNLASLTAGAYAVIDKTDSSAVYDVVHNIAATAEDDLSTKFQIAVMTANGLKMSPIITKANATCIYKDYNAPVAKVMNAAVVLSSIEYGQVFGLSIINNYRLPGDPMRERHYTYTAVTGATEAIVNAALIVLINADAYRCVTASAGTDIVLTGSTAGRDFQVATIGLYDATITITTPLEVGTGTAAQLKLYEKECQIEQGKGNYPQYRDLMFTNVSEVTTAETYDTWLIKYTVPNQRKSLVDDDNPVQELLIATLVSLSNSGDGKSCEGLTNLDADLGDE